MYHLATIQRNLNGIKAAFRVLVDRKSKMESMSQFIQPYIRFYKQLAAYYKTMGLKDKVIKCHERIVKQIQKYDISICKSKTICQYDDVAHMYLLLNDQQEAIHFFELSLKEEPHTVMESMSILYHLCTLHESINDGENISQCLEQLLQLQPELLDAPPSLILLHSENIRHITQFYRRNGKKEEANALDQKIVDSITGISTKPDYWTLLKAVKTVKDAFYLRNYSRAVQIGLQILPQLESSEEVDTRVIPHMIPTKYKTLGLEVRVLIGRAKFLSKNYTEGLDYLQTIFESDLMNFDSDSLNLGSVICNYLIFRPRYFRTCFPFEVRRYSLYQFGTGFLYYSLWYLPNVDVTLIAEFLSSRKSYHTVYPAPFRSQSTEVVRTGDRGLSIFSNTMFPWLINVNKTINSILESGKTSVLYGIGLVPFILIQICCCCCRVCIVIQFLKCLYKYFKLCLLVFPGVFIAFYSFYLEVV